MNTAIKGFYTLLILCISITATAQKMSSGEIGLFAGGSYYLGDLNKIPFVGSKPAFGVFYKHNFDKRFGLRGGINYGNLSGEGEKINQQSHQFSNSIFDIQVNAEFNFMPFVPGDKESKYSPYVLAGLGYSYYPGGEARPFFFNIPFGAGFKYSLNKQWIIGGEFIMKKTFNDFIDFSYPSGLENIGNTQVSHAGNTDWYSLFGIILTYKLKYRMKCPAFD